MQFKLTIRFKAENEAHILEFLQFIESSFGNEVTHGSADGESLNCHATLGFPSLADTITAVISFKAQFTISYKLEVE